MSFQSKLGEIFWKLHFNSSREKVYEALTTDQGRARFWAESTSENNDEISFNILNYASYTGRVLHRKSPSEFSVEYFGTIVSFQLKEDACGGTDLILSATQVDESFRMEMVAGWVSVLMAMKAAVDHGVDLRNHDEQRTWSKGYVDN